MTAGRMLAIGSWIVLFILTVHGNRWNYNGITIMKFCNCWNASIAKTGNDLHVEISFVKHCWESSTIPPDGFQIIHYESTMLFKIGVSESLRKIKRVKELPCQLNIGCFTTISMVRDTRLEIIPLCKSCDSCMGKKTDYIIYTSNKKNHTQKVVTVKPMGPSASDSYKSRFLVMAGVVIVVVTIATIIISILVCLINKRRIQQRGSRHLLIPDVGGSDTTDTSTDVSIRMEPNRSTEQSDTPNRRQSVKIGVFHPHIPKEFSSQTTENPLDAHVQRMITILTSVQELDIKILSALNVSNLFEGIDEVSCSPKIILVLCDRLCELCCEEDIQSGDTCITERWTDTERNLLKRIREKYILDDTSLYFVNFKHFKQQNNVLAEARDMFTSQSYKVFSVGHLDHNDDHFKQLLDSILSDTICDSEARSKRIMSLLNQDSTATHATCTRTNELEQKFMSLCEF